MKKCTADRLNLSKKNSGLETCLLKECHRLLRAAENEESLLSGACRLFIELGNYSFAWVGLWNEKDNNLYPAAWAGFEKGFLSRIIKAYSIDPKIAVPERQAARFVRPIQINMKNNNGKELYIWKKEAREAGFNSALVIPLVHKKEIFGALGIYSANSKVFSTDELIILQEMADSISFGLKNLRNDVLRTNIEKELAKNIQQLQRTMEMTIQALAVTIEMRDPYTAGHQRRVAHLASVIAAELGLSSDQIFSVRMSGIIHDIGKIYVPVEILTKPGRLNEYEISMIRSHPRFGFDILKETDLPQQISNIVLQHHERMNGSGYPLSLSGEEILIESKILSVADVVEAMSSHRPYRPSLGLDAALEEIRRKRGYEFDPDAVDACLALFKEKRFIWNDLEPTQTISN